MNDIIDTTKSWIEKVVVGLSFCPFAAKPFKEGNIRYKVVDGKSLEQALTSLVELQLLLSMPLLSRVLGQSQAQQVQDQQQIRQRLL